MQYDFAGDCQNTPDQAGDIFRICDDVWWNVVNCQWDFVVNRPPFSLDCVFSCEGALDGSGSSKSSTSTMASTGIIIIACVGAVVVAAAAALAVNHFRAKAHPKSHRRASMPDATSQQRLEAAAAAAAEAEA